MEMNRKAAQTLARVGAKRILTDLVNMPEMGHRVLREWGERREGKRTDTKLGAELQLAHDFIKRFGPLRDREEMDESGRRIRRTIDNHVASVLHWGWTFRQAWSARSEQEMESVGLQLDGVFQGDGAWIGPAIKTDFARGTWKPVPRDLLDALAIELIQSRKSLHRCERPECARYFIKSFSRDRYCSIPCGEIMRKRGQDKWAEENRHKINERRRTGKEKSL